MADLLRSRLGRTDVAENDNRSSRVALTVVDDGDGILDGNLQAVAPDESTAERQMRSSHLQHGELRCSLDGCIALCVQGSENLDHGLACRFLHRPTCKLLGDDI